MPRLIFKCPYIRGGSQKAVAHLSNYVRYMATREGAQQIPDRTAQLPATAKQREMVERLLHDFPLSRGLFEYEDYDAAPTRGNASEFITRALEDNYDQAAKKENYIQYIAHRPRAQRTGAHALFTGSDESLTLARVAEEIAQHTGSVWLPILSLRREDAARLGYDDAGRWKELLTVYAAEMAKTMNIPWNQFRWYAAFHRKEDSVHIHMVVFSSDPKEGYLTRQGIQQVKSAFGRRIFQQDLLHVYEQKTEYRDALGRDAERTMAELIAQMETGQIQNENLEQPILELSRRLQNTKGKTVYGYLPPTAKALVDAIVDELAKEERVAAAYDLWNQMREEVCRTYSEQLPERLLLSKQKEFKAVRNMVVREVLQLGRGEHPTADEIVHMPTPSGTPPAQSGLPYGAHHPQQEAAHHQRTQTHRAVSHADTARCVLQLFHSMGRIFREQSASDAIQTGLHIDRKRRRMLREKRMALGHKADDHEEIPQHSQR